ncbi:MAG: hypothetical protein JW869_00925 [Candidatus Omnitrophica bacterium]|nr:hypothetical protein [Candidatus Omnitrophota bacterium]
MYKRYQVLLNDWLADMIKTIANKYDISFSEVIRVSLCIIYGESLKLAFPKCKYGITQKDKLEVVKKNRKELGVASEELHNFFSKVYFETRKTIECWQAEHEKELKRIEKKAAQ